MTLPAAFASVLESQLSNIVESTPVGGGDISSAARVRLEDGREALIKWHRDAPAGMFNAERRGLELLRSAEALRVPQVWAQEESTQAHPAFIAMEWLGRGSGTTDVAETLGQELQTAAEEDPDKARDVAEAAHEVVEEAAAEKPDKKAIDISGDALEKAAKNIAKITPDVLLTVGKIVAFLARIVP